MVQVDQFEITGIHLAGSRGDGPITVSVEVNGCWVEVIREYTTNISHSVTDFGIAKELKRVGIRTQQPKLAV